MFDHIIRYIQNLYQTEKFIPLHEPRFTGNEKKYLENCIDSTFVSSVGEYVDRFEQDIAEYTGAKYAVATVNGTSALHIALKLAEVEPGDEVITQALTFVATCNAITYSGAHPLLLDVDKITLGLSPEKLEDFLHTNTENRAGECFNKNSGRRIKAVVPMHTFGLPVEIDRITEICTKFGLELVEDAAESLGSYYKDEHTGLQGLFGVLSFNGNKIITTGGGGMIITNDEILAKKAKHLTTTAKRPHSWEFDHDMVGYNYRMPNINAALGCAQLENLPFLLDRKRDLAGQYKDFFENDEIKFIQEPVNTRSNYWLNTVVLKDLDHRNSFLQETNNKGVMTRPVWKLMNHLEIYKGVERGNLDNAEWLERRLVNIPSSAILN